MNESSSPSFLNLVVSAIKRLSTIAKVAGISLLALLLLIPLSFVEDLLSERLQRRNKAIHEITSTWGDQQQVLGPILVVPYRYFYKTKGLVEVKGKTVLQETETAVSDIAYFLPGKLHITGNIVPRQLHKGIYQAVVYDANLSLSGEFPALDFAPFKRRKVEVLWDQARLAFPIRDLRGVSDTLKLKWGTSELALEPGSTLKFYPQGVHVYLPKIEAGAALPFQLNLSLRGSGDIEFAPLGVENVLKLTSTWPDPGFQGAYLPQTRKITPEGFEAEWRISYYGRNIPQQWVEEGSEFNMKNLASSYYGVAFVSLIDSYRSVERATKYGLLFIALVFVTFFLFETLTKLRVHTIQYTLVGAALVLFYLALLSLSEFVNFGLSYVVAALASTLLITLYSSKVLKSRRLTLALGGGLGVVYALLYFILQLQDYSLLAGTVGLFIALGAVMYVTRNIDWYGGEGKN